MPVRTIYRIFTVIALALVTSTAALAQSPDSPEVFTVPISNTTSNTWQAAQLAGATKGKLFVITLDQPDRRQTCHIQSFTVDGLVCSRAFGGSRIYLPQQIAALILPGDGASKLRFLLGLNGAGGAAIWGTVLLAATCPACAVGTGIAALLLFCASGAVLIGDDQPDRVLYLAPGQRMAVNLRLVQP
jgi:hypothetical protein